MRRRYSAPGKTVTTLLLGALILIPSPNHAQVLDPYDDGVPEGPGQVAGAAAGTATASVQGSVVNAITHQPIARALVSLDQYGQAMLTDNEGRFSFDGVPTGQTMLSARRPGFSSDDSGNANPSRQMVIVAATGADVTLELAPQSAITGELLLPGGDSPDGLQVQLLHQEIQNGRGRWSEYRSEEANSEGHFRFGNLPAGAYLVHVGASPDPAPAGQPSGSTKLRYGYVPAFYPDAREVAAAGVITLAAGQQADVKMELTREPYYPVAIPVSNYEDARGIGFEVSSASFLGLPARFSPQDGMVHMDLPAGHYMLEAHGFGERGINGEKEFDVNPGPGTARPGAITLLPVHTIPVTVHPEYTHTTVTSGDGEVLTAARQMSLDLQRDGDGPGTRGPQPRLDDGSDTRVADVSQLSGVSPGKYWVNASAFNGYIAAMTSGGVDLLQNPLTVGPDGSASPIEVTLRDDAATLSASLASSVQQDAQTAHRSIYLQLIPQTGAAIEHSAVFAADGTANLYNLPPGAYLAMASTSRRQIEYRNPAVMTALAGKCQSVSVEPGGTAHITIESLVDLPAGTPGGAI